MSQLYSVERAFAEHIFVSKFSKVLDLFWNALGGVALYFKCLSPINIEKLKVFYMELITSSHFPCFLAWQDLHC